MQRKFLIGVIGGAVAMVAVGAVGTHLLADPESTTELDEHSTVIVDGHKALAPGIVAGRVQSKYHPLPWVGSKVSEVTCPAGLKAQAGATVTCTGQQDGGKPLSIPVTVIKADVGSITWKFER
ncbi:DUF4333 domain-containing protein [Streptomyces arenae]|uniref:DUF4333 domain-containing protein n=1 Tax=Streptomyces arenae TaxID=29301 RepID=UPI00265A5B4E|nr:DUF4333 domain-containing protein [Streptomyces arenae]MCG7202637.1 DUF4333 domain-containing protein [Streptomyces arenae]